MPSRAVASVWKCLQAHSNCKCGVREGNQYHSVGWYDSNGSISSDPAQAFEVVVRDTDIDDLRITLPASFTPTPTKSESYSIKGVMIGPDDRAVTDTALSVWRGTKSSGSKPSRTEASAWKCLPARSNCKCG